MYALADGNSVTLILVPGHSGHEGNEEAERLARLGPGSSFFWLKPALGIPMCFLREAARTWTKEKECQIGANYARSRYGKLFVKEASKKKSEELLVMNKHRWEILHYCEALARQIKNLCRLLEGIGLLEWS